MKDVRPCFACGGQARRMIYRQQFSEGPLGTGYDVVVCNQCGAGFADGIPSQAELNRYYAERSKYEYTQNGGMESNYDFKRFEAIVDQIQPFLASRSAAILDIGCATGGLLASFKRRDYLNVLGIDPSPTCAAAARRLYGVEVVPLEVGELNSWHRRFDLILLVGVLEHLRDARAAVVAAARCLTPGGYLYCAQPDAEAFPECHNAPFQQFSTEHVNFFSEASLNRLLAESGLTPTATWRWMVEWREGMTDSVVSGLYRAGSRPAIGPDRVTEPALRRYVDECNERERMEIWPKIAALVASQEPVLIWGAGTLTRRLLVTSELGRMNISAFVDANVHLQGTRLNGRTVIAPNQVAAFGEKILILSRAFAPEIVRMIEVELKLPNPWVQIS
jgi:SAM-dependent methyltransferase